MTADRETLSLPTDPGSVLTRGVDAATGLREFRDVILAMSDPIAQRYTFARYVLGEDRLTACAIAGAFQGEPMDEHEYDYLAERWAA